jgi:hypothetical protein
LALRQSVRKFPPRSRPSAAAFAPLSPSALGVRYALSHRRRAVVVHQHVGALDRVGLLGVQRFMIAEVIPAPIAMARKLAFRA